MACIILKTEDYRHPYFEVGNDSVAAQHVHHELRVPNRPSKLQQKHVVHDAQITTRVNVHVQKREDWFFGLHVDGVVEAPQNDFERFFGRDMV
jgi:hypothetical protein